VFFWGEILPFFLNKKIEKILENFVSLVEIQLVLLFLFLFIKKNSPKFQHPKKTKKNKHRIHVRRTHS
jgi:hypothetical protein